MHINSKRVLISYLNSGAASMLDKYLLWLERPETLTLFCLGGVVTADVAGRDGVIKEAVEVGEGQEGLVEILDGHGAESRCKCG